MKSLKNGYAPCFLRSVFYLWLKRNVNARVFAFDGYLVRGIFRSKTRVYHVLFFFHQVREHYSGVCAKVLKPSALYILHYLREYECVRLLRPSRLSFLCYLYIYQFIRIRSKTTSWGQTTCELHLQSCKFIYYGICEKLCCMNYFDVKVFRLNILELFV